MKYQEIENAINNVKQLCTVRRRLLSQIDIIDKAINGEPKVQISSLDVQYFKELGYKVEEELYSFIVL